MYEVTAAEFAACAEKKPYLPHPMSISLSKPKSSGSLQGLNLSKLTLIKFVNWSVNKINIEIDKSIFIVCFNPKSLKKL